MNPIGLLVIVLLVIATGLAVVLPLNRPALGDRGDGVATVILPTPMKPPGLQVGAFVALSSAIGLVTVLNADRLTFEYVRLLGLLVELALPHQIDIHTYLSGIYALYPMLLVLGLSLVVLFERITWYRKLVSLLGAFKIAGFLVSVVAFLTVLAADWNVSPIVYQGLILASVTVIGILCLLSIFQRDLMLPRPVTFAFTGPRRVSAIVELLISVTVSSVLVVAIFVLVAGKLEIRGPIAVLGLLWTAPAISMSTFLVLFLISPKPIRGSRDSGHHSLTVITPAYNEQEIIARCLASIDDAAANFNGTVYVVLCNDGSTDQTKNVVTEAFMQYQHATGTLISLPENRGKAAALNTALAASTTEIIVRIDADTVIDQFAFSPLPDWFANPRVGQVGALDLPRPDQTAWYSYGRLFECLRTFAFGRLAQMRINGIVCVPGTFTAFRRSVAVSIGGFVDTMNGEDADLTIQFERLGYDVLVDTDIIIYEDVPQNWQEFRKQRVRWFRAGTQLFARHFTFRRRNLSTVMVFAIKFALAKYQAAVHPLIIFGTGVLILGFPSGPQIVTKLLVLVLLASIPSYALLGVLCLRYGYARKLIWLVILIPFGIAKRFAALESFMTIPGRGTAFDDNAMIVEPTVGVSVKQ
ncbi:MAG: glycosyltransferase family 2 protein [Acidimicrobiaceae bacterium]|nr:glycosyltransferase family 2 protein [Acidimicrobiaceae bacterium]